MIFGHISPRNICEGTDMSEIKGSDGSGAIKGTDGADTITFGEGDHTITAGGGDDVVAAGSPPSATLIADHDFNEKDTHGWSNATLDAALDDGDIYLGGFGSTGGKIATEQTFTLDAAKPAMVMEFQFNAIDSWDGEKFFIEINGEVVGSQVCRNSSKPTAAEPSSYTHSDGTTYHVEFTLTDHGDLGGYGSTGWYDSVFDVKVTAENPPETLKVGFGSTLNQAAGDESFAIDDFKLASTDSIKVDIQDPASFVGGASGNNEIDAGAGDDDVTGGSGSDTISGGEGADTITGGLGHDKLTGGKGADTFQVTSGDTTDTITDFELGEGDGFDTLDQIDVSQLTGGSGKDGAVQARDVKVTDDGFGNAQLIFPGGESLILRGVSPKSFDTQADLIGAGVPCFTAGTGILTPNGYRPVETLRAGDAVVTEKGTEPLLWVGARQLTHEDFAQRPGDRPIILRPAALGDHDRVRLSPQHAVRIGQRLVRAKHLAEIFGGKVARIDTKCDHVTYVHLFARRHSIVTADGVQAETFWPGPMGLAALSPSARLSLIAAFPAVALSLQNPKDLCAVYGPPAYPYMTQKDVRRGRARISAMLRWEITREVSTCHRPHSHKEAATTSV